MFFITCGHFSKHSRNNVIQCIVGDNNNIPVFLFFLVFVFGFFLFSVALLEQKYNDVNGNAGIAFTILKMI